MRRWLMAGLVLVTLPAPPAGSAAAPSPEAVLAGAARDVAAGNLAPAVSALLGLEGDSAPSAVRRQADLLLGVLLLRQGQRDEAIPRLERAAATYP
ncbi:MAG: hypothetical protein HYW08_06385, partial [candidate division NC10 bacterium]|nr:hypothetical protein [candidate division NC10 bacterium]